MLQPPSGTVTFLFTDLEGSTRLWEQQPDAMRAALGVHDEVLRQAIEAHGGYVFSTAGDAFAAAFGRASDAVDAAVDAQRALQTETWPGEIVLRVRMGIHTGEAVERDGDYFGPTLNRGDRASATALLAETIAVMRPAGRSSELDGACGYAVEIFERLGMTEAALVMIGAIKDGQLRVLREIPMPPSRHAPDVRAMRETVGEQRFAELLAAGAHMTYDEILDHILEVAQALAGTQ